MAQSRKDNRGRVLRKGEYQRKPDNKYVYEYTDAVGKRHNLYSDDLAELRRREEELVRKQMDGLDVYLFWRESLFYFLQKDYNSFFLFCKFFLCNHAILHNYFKRWLLNDKIIYVETS